VQWADQLRSFADLQRQLRSDPSAWINPKLLPDIRAAALQECPPKTVHDGIALQPLLCRAAFASLRCSGSSTEHCLTGKQLESLSAIVRAGYYPAAMVPLDWRQWILASPTDQSQLTFATEAKGTLMSQAPAFDVPIAGLKTFARRGGKIISYVGWADAVIAPKRELDWYLAVARSVGPEQRVSDFYRLFMIPGMIHCQGGDGPTQFGQSLDAPAASQDSRHDIRRALEAWVERHDPPVDIVAVDPTGRRARVIMPWLVHLPPNRMAKGRAGRIRSPALQNHST
jgi:feruloyl esterase